MVSLMSSTASLTLECCTTLRVLITVACYAVDSQHIFSTFSVLISSGSLASLHNSVSLLAWQPLYVLMTKHIATSAEHLVQ